MNNHIRFSDDYEVVWDETEDETLIAVMGATGSGKTTFINLASGSALLVGDGLKSCTAHVQFSRPFEIGGRLVTLIDTPGFDDTTISDTDILKMIAGHLVRLYEEGQKLSGIIYLHRISDPRMTGISRRNFTLFRKLCGEETLRNVIIATTMWGEVNSARGLAREDELATDDMFFKPVLDKGATMLRHDNSRESTHAIISQLLPYQKQPLLIQQELVDQHRDISETSAGLELVDSLRGEARRYHSELRDIEQARAEARRENDMQTAQEMDEEYHRTKAKLEENERKQTGFSGRAIALSLAVGLVSVIAGTLIQGARRRSTSPPP